MTDEEMFNKNIKLAFKIANKYRINYACEYDDIKQIALIGLWKSVLTFDKVRTFSSYAYAVITNEINLYLRTYVSKLYDHCIGTPLDENIGIKDYNDPIENLIEACDESHIKKCIKSIYLRDLEKDVLRSILKGKSQNIIAKELGISQSYVSRIYIGIVNKIKSMYLRGGY